MGPTLVNSARVSPTGNSNPLNRPLRSLGMPTYRSPARMLATLLLAVLLAQPTSTQAGPILFDFETPPISDAGNGINPTFESEGFEIRFSNPERRGAAQWVNDDRSNSLEGTGSIRLIGGASFLPDAAAMLHFSELLNSISLDITNIRADNTSVFPAALIAFGADGSHISSREIPPVGTLESPIWSKLSLK